MRSPEYAAFDGRPIHPALKERAETMVKLNKRELTKTREFVPGERTLRDIFKKVDFKILADIFIEKFRRSGLTANDLNLLRPSDFFYLEKPQQMVNALPPSALIGATLIPIENKINFLPANILNIARHYVKVFPVPAPTPEQEDDLTLFPEFREIVEHLSLATLFHEETHAASYTQINLTPVGVHSLEIFTGRPPASIPQALQYRELKNGFNVHNTQDWDGIFVGIDEAVTQKLAYEVLEEYLRQTGDFKFNSSRVQNMFESNLAVRTGRWSVVPDEQKLLEELINRLAQSTGVDYDSVWNSLVRGKFEGLDLRQTEVGTLLEENTYRGLMTDLKKLTPTTVSGCIAKLKN